MDFTTLQIFFAILCTLFVPLASQTPDDKYVITADLYQRYIYIYKGDVISLSESHLKRNWTSLVTSIAVDVRNSTVFVLDFNGCISSISRFASSTASLTVMHCGMSKSVDSIMAYDWVTSNMYWSDRLFQWIALRPIYTQDRYLYRVIIEEVTDISAMTVDPINRYIFWFDNSASGGRIERASLDGQQRKPIMTKGLLVVYDIVADVTSKRLFWVDYSRYSIESANYEGFERRLLIKLQYYKFIALAVDEEYVCATQTTNKMWYCLHKMGRDNMVKSVEPAVAYDIAIFNKAIQPKDKPNSCASTSCQHFCVNGDDKGICMCKEGYTLNQDGKTCLATHGLFGKGILVSYKTQICILDYRSIIDDIEVDFRCTHTGLQGVEYLEVNAAEHVVFYYDSVNRLIKSYDLKTRISKTIQGSTAIVSGLSFDWNQKKLYWCESNTGKIGRVSLRNYIAEIFLDSDKDVNDISVDPHNRNVFWIEERTRILSSKMEDGENRTFLHEDGTKSGLFFEIKSRRLFWIQSSVIVSIKDDGSEMQYYESASSNTQLIIFKSYFIWISDKRKIDTLPTTRDHNTKTTITLPNNDTITEIAVFDENSQPIEKGACDVNNGGCDHICIVVIDGRVCRCQFGFMLKSDNKTCGTVPLNQDFLLATDSIHSRIYQVDLKSGSLRALDIPLVKWPNAVRYDSTNKYLYWSDANSEKIMRATKDGKSVSVVYSSVFGTHPERIELDQSSGYLYFITLGWLHFDYGYIGVINTHNMYSNILIDGLQSSHGFALYPSKGILYFTNTVSGAVHIYRSPIDGSFRTRIHTTALAINDLIIDYNADRLYWSELNNLWSSDLSGSSLKHLVTTSLTIHCIVFAHPFIYYYSDEYSKIIKFDVTKRQSVTWMSDMPEIGHLVSLDIDSKGAMPGNLLCAKRNGMCSTFCIPRQTSITCGCQEGVSLLRDKRTCEGVTKCSEHVRFGSLEAACQRYSRETCTFACESDYIPKVQPQTVTCQENGTWDHDLSDMCSENLATETTSTAVIVGGTVAGVVAIAIGVAGIVMLRRKKSGGAQINGRQSLDVYYLSQSESVDLSLVRQQISTYSENSKLSLKTHPTGNSYTS